MGPQQPRGLVPGSSSCALAGVQSPPEGLRSRAALSRGNWPRPSGASTGPREAQKGKNKMKNIKLINMNDFEEITRDISAWINLQSKTLNAEVEIEGVKYKGSLSLKSGYQVALSQYSQKAELIEDDHEIIEYLVSLWGKSEDPLWPDFKAVIYADLGQNDRQNPKLSEIRFIGNEEQLKNYIADLIDEIENPWWDREED